jgi:CBS domain-containing protein
MALAPLHDWLEGPMKARSHPAHYASGSDTIRQVAALMQKHRCSAVLLQDAAKNLTGIITDKDLRKAAALGMDPSGTPARDIMSAPVRTFADTLSLAEAQIAMLRFGISHLVLTRDGEAQHPVTGLVSQRDILVTQSHNPALLIRKIRKAEDLDTLRLIADENETLVKEYLESNIPLPHVARIQAALTDALHVRIMEQRLQTVPDIEGHPFAWLALGSLGREEQLLRTDQDNALIFADPTTGDAAVLKKGFLEFAEGVTRDLNALGFLYCPAEMMARNPSWCLPLSEWKKTFSSWIREPDEQGILHSCIFFDYRSVFGDPSLVYELDAHIQEELVPGTLFIGYQAVNTLKTPRPMGLFGSLIKEASGEGRGCFDLKARGLMPLADAARTLCLDQEYLHPTSTLARFAFLIEREPQNAAFFRQCREAYLGMLKLRVDSGFQNRDTGRFIPLSGLDAGQRKQLKSWLKVLRPLKNLLETRYRVSGMR